MIVCGVIGVIALARLAFVLFSRPEVRERRATKGRGCPQCGSLRYRLAAGQENEIVIARGRICEECKHEYSVPPPWWVGLIAYFMALLIVAAMVIDMVAPPRDWDFHLTWKGRLGVLCLAIAMIWMGTYVIRGDSRTRSDT
jgi:hypothetical protein